MSNNGENLDLFAPPAPDTQHPEWQWPSPQRFPLNHDQKTVGAEVEADLLRAQQPLIISGYASLNELLSLTPRLDGSVHLRILFGHEPYSHGERRYNLGGNSLPKEAEHYWLEKGISLTHCCDVLALIEALKNGDIEARFMPGNKRLHAKIYATEHAATVGSSNFTYPGLRGQFEANTRFEKDRDEEEFSRYNELSAIAEHYWNLGSNYRDELIALLEKLLQAVSWPEALARACAELLEGEWAQRYLRNDLLGEAESLWPSQRQGIGQALYVLSNHGSVLIADATGAGKTRMGTYLIGAITDQILREGRMRQGKAIMIAPPTVLENWQGEANKAGVALDVYSHGGLSRGGSKKHDNLVDGLRRAQVLCIDEGHNFLNTGSNRTQQVMRNLADHVVLLTATPINRGEKDLLRIADMLGADNLEESTLEAFDKLLSNPKASLSFNEAELDILRQELQRFTVRRTKSVLNKLINREPEHYRNHKGETCRFPKHNADIYALDEPGKDRALAKRIHALCQELTGIAHFQKPLEMPAIFVQQGTSAENYLAGRLNAARKLVAYMVGKSLRSSRAALWEHLYGTELAARKLDLKELAKHKSESGNIVATLDAIAGNIPENRLGIELPLWLSDPDQHREACMAEKAIYQRIGGLLAEMSDHREKRKAAYLGSLLQENKHELVLAFDSRPITLAYIKHLLSRSAKLEVIAAWGGGEQAKQKIIRTFAPDSNKTGIIGLCSDSLSEGVNLQKASAIVHLDMPTVVRIAEQRAGRVDRLDSPHQEVTICWPKDAEEFVLSSDSRFVERYQTVDSLLGSNFLLPSHLTPEEHNPLTPEAMMEEMAKNQAKAWDGISDAFEPVRQITEGESALIDAETYQRYRTVSATVLSRVSVVPAKSPWAFFCLSSGSFAAPRWLILPSYMGGAETDLAKVADALRERLSESTENLSLDAQATEVLQRFLERLNAAERNLLPRKKQRALEEMQWALEQLNGIKNLDSFDQRHLKQLYHLLTKPQPEYQPDWNEVANRWLDLIKPLWFEKINTKRTRPLLLKDLRQPLMQDKAALVEHFKTHFHDFPVLPDVQQRIKACIVGVPRSIDDVKR